MNLFLITGDKRRDLNLELITDIHSIPELPAHLPTPESLGISVTDSTLLFWGHVDHFYIKWLSFVLFYLMTHLYRRYGSALDVSDSSIFNITN